MATGEFPQNEGRRPSSARSTREAWTPTFDGPPAGDQSERAYIVNNGFDPPPSGHSRRDPRIHPAMPAEDDKGRLLDVEEQRRRRRRPRGGGGNGMFRCVCCSLVTILIIIVAVVTVAVVWALTGFRFGITSSGFGDSSAIVGATLTTTPPTTKTTASFLTTDDDVTEEMMTYDMTTS